MSESDSDFSLDESPKKKKAPAKPKQAKEPKAAKESKIPKVPKDKGTPKKKGDGGSKKEKDEGTVDVNEQMAEEDKAVFVSLDNMKKAMSIEDIYQRKTQLEHILLRPDTYIGSVDYTEKTPMWVYDPEAEKIVYKDISYVPGLYKIFDEILVNAADNKQRDPKMTLIKIDISKEKNLISVYNNGKGVPVTLHKIEKMYVPELIFGTLLTSSNYDDSEKKTTGGRNGYGAKLCNIFSSEFTLETSSKEYGKAFKQTWINNMSKDKDATIVKSMGEDYTKVTFKPDLTKFKMTELDDDIIHLMMRRAFDIAGSTRGVKVFLNGKQVPVSNFKQYVELYTKDAIGDDAKVIYEHVNERWEVALTVSEGQFKQMSFVNSIATTKGGRHVDYVSDQMVSKMIDTIKKKVGKSTVNVRPYQVKNHMWVFVNCLIENPTFDSQTKETMTLQAKSFGSKCELSDKFSKGANSCGVVDAMLTWVKFKQQEDMNKKCSGKKTTKLKGIPKLEDANDAGTKNAHLCTLILTEGDSAKTLAVSGLAVVGRDRYGVFPLRGKLLNVREGNIKQVADNAEVNALIKILGLQYKRKYDSDEDFKSLRYGSVMIMADQDQDGSHIKGLVINFIHHNWASLIRRGFVEQFITPIIKAIRGKDETAFFSIPEYEKWKANNPDSEKFRIKYYKGLGTSTSKEAKEYFSDMTRHRIKFKYNGPEDDAAVDMAFSKKKVEERKDWLTKWMAEKKARREQGEHEEYLYGEATKHISYTDFINKELVLFSNTDNERSIPSLVDGLKPGQRKVVFACFKRADKREVKVAQLAGAVGELSAYHHGEASLMGTIVNLAQDFVGSNNINLLLPIGQFGTRLQGGKDSASPRYIFTKLSPVARYLFPTKDDDVLRFLFEDNQRIEPEWYCPIIPTVLVNGAAGIGTAWSTNIPNYNPKDVVENIRRLIKGQEQKSLIPWYKGFRGEIIQLDSSRFVCNGEVAILNDDTVEITELPVKTWTQTYKETVLESLIEGGGSGEGKDKSEKKNPIISDFKEYHTDTTVRFVVKFVHGKLRHAESEGLHKVLKLQTVINTTSMVLFDAAGCLRKFNTPEEICAEFFETRKKMYMKRKAYLEGMLLAQSSRLSNQAEFIKAKISGKIVMEDKKKAAIVKQLQDLKFLPDPVKAWKDAQKKDHPEDVEEEVVEEDDDQEKEKPSDLDKSMADYDYLVGLALIKLSNEEKTKLENESNAKKAEHDSVKKKTWSDMWNEDLDEFLVQLKKREAQEKADQESAIKKKLQTDGKRAGAGGRIATEIMPSKDGIRIEPAIDKAMKDKYEKLAAPKKEKVKKEPKEPKEPKEKKPKKEASEKSPFEKKAKKPKRDEWNSDESSAEEMDYEEGETNALFEDEASDKEEIMPKAAPRSERRSRKPIINASDDGLEEEAEDNDESVPPTPVKPVKKVPAKKKIEVNGDDTSAPATPAKAPAKKAAPKKRKANDSDDDESAPVTPAKASAKRAKMTEDDGDDSSPGGTPQKGKERRNREVLDAAVKKSDFRSTIDRFLRNKIPAREKERKNAEELLWAKFEEPAEETARFAAVQKRMEARLSDDFKKMRANARITNTTQVMEEIMGEEWKEARRKEQLRTQETLKAEAKKIADRERKEIKKARSDAARIRRIRPEQLNTLGEFKAEEALFEGSTTHDQSEASGVKLLFSEQLDTSSEMKAEEASSGGSTIATTDIPLTEDEKEAPKRENTKLQTPEKQENSESNDPLIEKN